MELSEIQKQDYKNRLLDVFKATIRFLDENELTWWAYAGTAIGAVRHHGMIPWDDDVDIFMPYEDYSRLQHLTTEFEKTRLELYVPFKGDYYCPYVKIADKYSTVSESECFKFVSGVWIDVFPLYKTNATKDMYWKYVEKYGKFYNCLQRGNMRFVGSELKRILTGFHLRTLVHWIATMTYYKVVYRRNMRKFQSFLCSINDTNGHYYMYPYTYMHCLNLFPIEWFRSTIDTKFEDFTVKIPIDNDKILTCLYGDYMTLPPLERRVSTHNFYYVNLQKHLTFDEIRQLVLE